MKAGDVRALNAAGFHAQSWHRDLADGGSVTIWSYREGDYTWSVTSSDRRREMKGPATSAVEAIEAARRALETWGDAKPPPTKPGRKRKKEEGS